MKVMKKDIRMMKAVAAAVLGNSFFGLSFLFSKVALERLEPFVLLAVRFIVAFVMLNLVLLKGEDQADGKAGSKNPHAWAGAAGSLFYI